MALTQVPIELSSTPGIVDNSNATAITIDSSENVGIGTSSPSAELSVSNSGAEGYEVSPATVIGNTIRQLAFNRSTSAYMPIRTQASQHEFYAGSSEAMRIDASGNVGIGASNPSSYFAPQLVVQSSTSYGGITIRSNSTTDTNYLVFADGTSGNERYRGYVSYDHNADTMKLATGASPAITIDSSSNVGIGGTPTAPLHVFGGGILGASSTNPIAFTGSSSVNAGIGSYNANTDFNVYAAGTGNIKFQNSSVWNSLGQLTSVGTERMRITSDGELLLNATGNPGAALLHVEGPTNKHAKSIDSHNAINGSSETAIMAEGTVSVNTVSSGTVLSIPFQSQSSVWRRYTIEFMFCSGEYNDSGNGKSGTATVKLGSLTGLSSVFLLDSTGTVSSVGSSGMNLQITFSSGFTGGLNNYEGVLVYYKILSSRPSYCQMWNATLN